MAAPELDGGVLPSLPPLRTAGAAAAAERSEAEAKVEAEVEGVDCVTPKSCEAVAEKSKQVECPPPPRKPRPLKRKVGPPANGYFPVPSDLAAVFKPLARPVNVSKKIRVG